MAKLKLNLDTLAVESFETAEQAEAQGTVHGHVHQEQKPSVNDQMTICYQNTCAGFSCYTCSWCMTIDFTCAPAEQKGDVGTLY